MLEKINHKSAPDEVVNALITLYHQGKFDDVLSRSSQLIKEYPNTFVLHNIVGAISFEKGEEEIAIKHFRKVIEIVPHHYHAYNNLGVTLLDIGEYEEAISNLKKAIELQPDYAEAYNNLGNVYKEMEEYNMAISKYKKAIKLNPEYHEAYNNLGVAIGKYIQYNEALEAYNKAISIKSDFAETYNNMGIALQDQAKLNEAIESFNIALSIKPNYADAHYNKGVVLQDQGKLEDALESFNKALSIKPDFAETYNNMGIALKEQCRQEEAIEAYKKALSLKPDFAKAYINMGNVLKDQSKLEEAIESYNKALLLKPDYAEAYINIGNVLKDQGKLEEAIESYNKALSLKPDYAEVYNNMGNILTDQGKLEEAIETYKKALSLKPDYTTAHRNLSLIKKYSIEDEHFIQVKEHYRIRGLSEDEKCNLSFALAKMYEDIGDLNQAFNHLYKGNALRKKLLNYTIKIDKSLFNCLKKTQPVLLESSLEIKKGYSGLSPVFIVGMPRSGTTLVEQIISSHSEVTGAGELKYTAQYGGELAINSAPINTVAISDFRKKYFYELSKVSKGKSIITDKMPQNFRFIPLICAAFPEAKIIHVQRNATATCWSNFKHYFAVKGLGYCYNLEDLVTYYELYIDLMELWQSEYSDRIYNLNYESLTTDQENQTRKLMKYLELNWEEACLSPQNNKRSIRTLSQQQVRKKIYKGSSNAWFKYEPYLNGAFDSLVS